MSQLGQCGAGDKRTDTQAPRQYQYREPWRFRQWEIEEERQEREEMRQPQGAEPHLNEDETRWLESRSRDFVDTATREERWGQDSQSQGIKRQTGDLYYEREAYPGVLREEKEMETDVKAIQSMYPEEARQILPYVWEVCDRMEYEGSMMFDERPDLVTVRRLTEEVLEKAEEQGGGCPGEMAQVVLLQEMYRRRCRYRRFRRTLTI